MVTERPSVSETLSSQAETLAARAETMMAEPKNFILEDRVRMSTKLEELVYLELSWEDLNVG